MGVGVGLDLGNEPVPEDDPVGARSGVEFHFPLLLVPRFLISRWAAPTAQRFEDFFPVLGVPTAPRFADFLRVLGAPTALRFADFLRGSGRTSGAEIRGLFPGSGAPTASGFQLLLAFFCLGFHDHGPRRASLQNLARQSRSKLRAMSPAVCWIFAYAHPSRLARLTCAFSWINMRHGDGF